jgi:hypothetical protein
MRMGIFLSDCSIRVATYCRVIQSWLGMATDLSQLQRDFSPIKGQEAGLELEHAERSVKIRQV